MKGMINVTNNSTYKQGDMLDNCPHDLEIERAILGALMVNSSELLEATINRVEVGDFHYDSHRKIYSSYLRLHSSGVIVEPLTIKADLENQGHLDIVGGMAYIASLMDGSMRLTLRNMVGYIKILKEHSRNRRITLITSTLQTDATSKQIDKVCMRGKAQEVLDILNESDEIKPLTNLSDVLAARLEHAEAVSSHEHVNIGLMTNYRQLDQMTNGLQPADYVIIGARPSQGKSALGLNVVDSFIKNGKKGLLVSIEMSEASLLDRMLCSGGRVDSNRYRAGFLNTREFQRIHAYWQYISTLDSPLVIEDTPNISVPEIKALAQRVKRERGLDYIVIDYIQLIRPHTRKDSRNLELGDISKALKALAKEMGIVIIGLAQLSREVEKRSDQRPMLSDLRESGNLEQDADIVIFIHKPKFDNENPDCQDADLIVAKNRNGSTGTCPVRWIKEYTRFEDLQDFEIGGMHDENEESEP